MTEKRIRKAFEHVAPDHLQEVLEQCNAQKQQQKGKILSMTNTASAPRRRLLPRILAAAATLALLLTGTAVYGLNTRVCATVALDVNPSIELNVNRRERVVSVSPINDDGKKILGDMDLSGSDLQVAVNALVGSMLRQGYLSELSNSILISVDSSDPNESASLQEKLTQEVVALLDTSSFAGAVLSQTVETDAELSSLAEQYGLTPGKAQLIRRITESHPQHTFEELAGLSVNELNLLLTSAPNDTESSASPAISTTGRASDRAYIGSEQAKAIVLNHIGLAEKDVAHFRLEMDYENGRMVYDIEIKANGAKYDVDIDALTGEILKVETEPVYESHAAAPASTAFLSADEARDIVLKHADIASSDLRDWKCKLDEEDGRMVYEISFKTDSMEYDYEISAATGEICKAESERVDNALSSSARLSESEARSIVLKHANVSSADVTDWECELDTDDGVTLFEIEFKAGGYEYDYEVNVLTGSILKHDRELDD